MWEVFLSPQNAGGAGASAGRLNNAMKLLGVKATTTETKTKVITVEPGTLWEEKKTIKEEVQKDLFCTDVADASSFSDILNGEDGI